MREFWKHWSALARRLHWWTLLAFAFLLLTGLVFYLPSLRGATAGYRHLLRFGHVFVGLALVGLTLAAFWGRALRTKLVRRARVKADLVLALVFVAALTVTGVPLWVPEYFPIALRNLGIHWHGRVALVGTVWLIYHALASYALPLVRTWWARLAARRAAARRETAKLRRPTPVYTRKQFLRQLGWAAGLLAVLGFARPWDLRLGQGDTTVAGDAGGSGAAAATGRATGPAAGAGAAPGASGGISEAERAETLSQFRIYTVTRPMPGYDPESYRFEVTGMVERPLKLTFAELERLPSVHSVSDFHCVTGWGVQDVVWDGVRIEEIIKRAKPHPDARYITFYSADGVYTDSLSLEQAQAPDVLMAYKMMGAYLRPEHGAPLRLIVPQMYGYKGPKWLYKLEFTDRQVIGFWERRGYAVDAYIRDA